MPLSRLELVSAYGDQTLPRVRFVVYGTSSATDALSTMDAGLIFTEGRPTVSTDIVYAHNKARGGGANVGEPGSVLLCAVPSNYYLGYGIFTTAYIDRQARKVTGAPLRYAAARKQLAIYVRADTEASRMHVEAEVANGYPLEQHPQFMLDTKYILGGFPAGSGFDALISQLDVAIGAMQPLEFERFERSFMDVLRLRDPANIVLAATAIRDVVVGTVESSIVSRMRLMRWQGLKLLGYSLIEGDHEVQIAPVADVVEQRRRMDDMGRLIASSSLFGAELSWLKSYVAHELEVMRVELDGAELEALPD